MPIDTDVFSFLEDAGLPLAGLPAGQASSLRNTRLRGVTQDSRRVEPGFVFLAIRGVSADGHDYLSSARLRGAAAAVVERRVDGVDIPQIEVTDARAWWGRLVAAFCGDPHRHLTFVGVTGTNGKTTTTTLLHHVLSELGFVPGLIGTIAYRWKDRKVPSEYTSPDPEILFPLLERMRADGVDTVIMEVSSHSLAQRRLGDIRFKAAVLTNFTQDHLDFHGTMEEYAAAKSLLFTEHLAPRARVAAWTGNPWLRRIVPDFLPVTGYDAQPGPDVQVWAKDIRESLDGLDFIAVTPDGEVPVHSPLVGTHNVQNLLAVASLAYLLELDLARVMSAASRVTVPGRLARVIPGDVAVFVDYAHTPDALDRAQAALRPLVKGRLFTVFGCGGDRDRTKRPLMGRSVQEHSDIAVVTSDNPRTEDPLSIIGMILEGMDGARLQEGDLPSAERGIWVEPDRSRAIAAAIAAARPDDCVLIAGKGHEDYQIIGKVKHHFDDAEQAADALRRRMEDRGEET